MKNTHICFVSDTLYSYFREDDGSGIGGAERQQYLLAHGLQEQGYHISIATRESEDTHSTDIDGLDMWNIIPSVRGVLRSPLKAIKTILGLRQISADVYYVRGNDFLCFVTAVYARVMNAKFLYAVANDYDIDPSYLPRRGLIRYPFLWGIGSTNLVIAQTDHQQALLEKEHGINSVVIPNGYTIPPDDEILPHQAREYVLWVGSIDPEQKKPERILRLASLCSYISFRIIGTPDNDHPAYFREFETKAREIPNVEFMGFVPPDNIHEHYRNALALVNTSDYEGFPNVYLEAWRFATPVVSLYHDFDGLFEKDQIGIMAGSMDVLTDTIKRIDNDVEFRKSIGEAGREYMKDHYSLEQLITKYECHLERI